MGVLPWLAVMCCGIWSAAYSAFASWWLAAPPVAALLVLLLRHRPVWCGVAAIPFFFLTGFVLCGLALHPPKADQHILQWADGEQVIVAAEVVHAARRSGGKAYLDLLCLSLLQEGRQSPVHGRLRLFLDSAATLPLPGDRLHFRARLRQPYPFGTPGEFHYPRHLAARGIYVSAHLKSLEEAAVFAVDSNSSPRRMAGSARARTLTLIQEALGEERGALLAALLIGDKGALSDQQREVLARGGVAHLFSISGMHLGLVAFYVYHLLYFIWRRVDFLLLHIPPRRYLPLFLLPFLWAYLLLTGEALPTQRAFFMTVGAALLWLLCYRTGPLNLLWSAAFVFLSMAPLLFFEVSFQMSFAGVLGIMLLVPHWAKRGPQRSAIVRWIWLLFLTTLAATLATLPLTLLHFHLLAPAALLTNLFAVPLVSLLVLPTGLIALLLGPFWAQGAQWLLVLSGLALQLTFDLVAWFVAQPLLGGWRFFAAPVEMLAVFVLALAVLLWQRLPAVACVTMVLVGGFLLAAPASSSSGLQVVALSVGQGDATLLSFEDGSHMLIDGGGLHSESFDVGERLVAPALGFLGVRHLDAVVLTHDHPDHRKGLHFVLRHFSVSEFWAPAELAKLDPELAQILLERQIPIRYFAPGWTVIARNAAQLAVFRPQGQTLSLNDQSLVVYAADGSGGVLLTGDLESAGVQELLLHQFPGPVCLLKLPHHGSGRSRTDLLVDQLRPDLTFASAGRNNVYGLPAQSLVGYLAQESIPLLRTDTQGSLRFSRLGTEVKIDTWQHGAWRQFDGAIIAK